MTRFTAHFKPGTTKTGCQDNQKHCHGHRWRGETAKKSGTVKHLMISVMTNNHLLHTIARRNAINNKSLGY
eukprot:3433747-Amphidinium_carterae.2